MIFPCDQTGFQKEHFNVSIACVAGVILDESCCVQLLITQVSQFAADEFRLLTGKLNVYNLCCSRKQRYCALLAIHSFPFKQSSLRPSIHYCTLIEFELTLSGKTDD